MSRQIIAFALFCLCLASAAYADGDIAKGEKVFKRCAACHAIEDSKNKVGPSLLGVFARAVGSAEGYAYSDDLVKMKTEGKTWDNALLDAYLANPKAIAPKGKMAFGGLRKPEDRADLIAFLKSLAK